MTRQAVLRFRFPRRALGRFRQAALCLGYQWGRCRWRRRHLPGYFTSLQPNESWVGDITYIWTREGWLYLAILVDLFSRRVVGWSMSESLATDLAIRALTMAIDARGPPRGLLHHSDRGCQYASTEYRAVLDQHGLRASMSRKGNCWDNAVAESFFATLKVELVRDADFLTRDQARTQIFEYIEVFYNRQRLHSFLEYAIPNEFELGFTKRKIAA